MSEKTVWGIHAGRFNEAESVFLDQKKIALGWSEMGDLKKLPADREGFKKKVAECYPKDKPGSWPGSAGQLFRFVYEMKIGDIVVWPSRMDKKIHIGEVTGDYTFQLAESNGFPHQRSVKWLKTIDRINFSQAALYEIGSAMSFFQVRNYAEDFTKALSGGDGGIGKIIPVDPGPSPDELEQITKDFILKILSTEMKGFPLEDFIAHLLEKLGYRTRISKHGGDEGIDIIAHKDELGFEPPIIKVQVKSRNDTVKQDEVAALFGRLAGANEVGLFVTLGRYAAQARSFARGKEKLRLIDGDELVDLIFDHYDEFDARYKGLIPLRKVFVPEQEVEE